MHRSLKMHCINEGGIDPDDNIWQSGSRQTAYCSSFGNIAGIKKLDLSEYERAIQPRSLELQLLMDRDAALLLFRHHHEGG